MFRRLNMVILSVWEEDRYLGNRIAQAYALKLPIDCFLKRTKLLL